MTRFFRATQDLVRPHLGSDAASGFDADDAIFLPTIIHQLVKVFSQWI